MVWLAPFLQTTKWEDKGACRGTRLVSTGNIAQRREVWAAIPLQDTPRGLIESSFEPDGLQAKAQSDVVRNR